MRSRYTAYVLGDETYLLKTWHPRTRPASLDFQLDPAIWDGLQILRCEAGGETERESSELAPENRTTA